MDARHRAVRGAGLLCQIFAADVFDGVLLQRDPRIAALLRAVVHQPVLANVEITRARAAAPLVRLAQGDVVLERIDASEAAPFEVLHLMIDAALFVSERLQLAVSIVNDSDGGAEP